MYCCPATLEVLQKMFGEEILLELCLLTKCFTNPLWHRTSFLRKDVNSHIIDTTNITKQTSNNSAILLLTVFCSALLHLLFLLQLIFMWLHMFHPPTTYSLWFTVCVDMIFITCYLAIKIFSWCIYPLYCVLPTKSTCNLFPFDTWCKERGIEPLICNRVVITSTVNYKCYVL